MKYRNVRITTRDGSKFDSGLEYKRWIYLKQLQQNGEITNLKRQIPYTLIPSQKDSNGKVLFREVKYVSDFEYDIVKTGEHIVEDTKGVVLPIFKLKQKMMYFFFGIQVKVIKKW